RTRVRTALGRRSAQVSWVLRPAVVAIGLIACAVTVSAATVGRNYVASVCRRIATELGGLAPQTRTPEHRERPQVTAPPEMVARVHEERVEGSKSVGPIIPPPSKPNEEAHHSPAHRRLEARGLVEPSLPGWRSTSPVVLAGSLPDEDDPAFARVRPALPTT